SRRRHTRSYGDWSSDVCSSDLAHEIRPTATKASHRPRGSTESCRCVDCSFGSADESTTQRGTARRALCAGAGASSYYRAEKGGRSEERRVGKECRLRWWTDR